MDLTGIGSIATAVGVFFAAMQVAGQRAQFRTSFADGLWREQREIVAELPIDLVLMGAGDETFDPRVLGELERSLLYRYFSLTDEQALLAKRGRVGSSTWYTWQDSIVHNMRRPAFAHAWSELGDRAPAEFRHLTTVLDGSHRLSRRRDLIGRAARRAAADQR